ncbi:MAG: type II toxin-antitoxin system RelE/ParE family toxin [Cyclobacteriaceae bacterium]|nr:type II toxin-antitoxin system RelE/ParE family toxin [Cyclobacteriaceae bacterium]
MTTHPYRVTHAFELDFWDIQEWLYANESANRTEKIIASILEKLEHINQNPLHFPEHSQKDPSGKPLRKAVHFETYVIFYRVHSDYVEFLSIFHANRNRTI